jgi:hypothetical protein
MVDEVNFAVPQIAVVTYDGHTINAGELDEGPLKTSALAGSEFVSPVVLERLQISALHRLSPRVILISSAALQLP